MLKQKLQTHKHVCMMCHSTIPLFGKAYVDLDPELSMENVVLLKTSPRTCHHWKYCSSLSKPHCWSLLGSNKCRIERLCDHVCVLIGPFFFLLFISEHINSHPSFWPSVYPFPQLLEYVGKGKSIMDVGLAQARQPLTTRCHYYELEIVDAGEKCYIALGLARRVSFLRNNNF